MYAGFEEFIFAFSALETSKIAVILNESAWAYPAAICAHAIGMGIFVGIATVGHLWAIGLFPGIPARSIRKLFYIAWPALGLNVISGLCMFVAQAAIFIVHPFYLAKMAALIAAALITLYFYRNVFNPRNFLTSINIPYHVRALSVLVLVLLLSVIVSGRLVAYTGGFA